MDRRGHMGHGKGRWLQTCRGHSGVDTVLQEEEGAEGEEEDAVGVFFCCWKRSPLNEQNQIGRLNRLQFIRFCICLRLNSVVLGNCQEWSQIGTRS